MGPGNHALDGVPDHRMGRNNFEAEGESHCKVKGHSAVICAKTAEPIEMPFALWTRMDPRNHVLDGGPELLRDVAMVTILWLSMSYNFGCMIASDTLFDSRGGLRGEAIR